MIYDIGFNKTYDEDDFTLTNTSFTASTIEISGQVINFASSAGLENAVVRAENLTNPNDPDPENTPLNGTYEFKPFDGSSYDISVEINGDKLGGNGCVNSMDLDTLMEHILGRSVFTEPFEYIAGDVSEDGSITTYDALQLNKELVGNTPNQFNRNWTGMSLDEYSGYSTPASGVPTIDGKISLNNVTSSSTLNDFYAIKGGDVDKSCAGAIATLSFTEKQENLRLAKLSQQSLVKGEFARIPIYGPDYTSTNVISLSFKPIADVKVLGTESGSIEVKDFNFNISDKVIDFLWATSNVQGTRIDKDEPLFFIKVESLAAIENVGSRIKLKNHRPYTNIVTKLGSKEYSSIQMLESSSFPDLGGIGVSTDIAKSHRNHFSVLVSPNPVSSVFDLSIFSKNTYQVEADLKIIQGSTGALISTRSILLHPGNNVFFIDELNGKPGGFDVYKLFIDGGNSLASGKFIKLK